MARFARSVLRFALVGAGVAFATLPSSARADVELPPGTPTAKIVQQVGLTEITVDYDRPAVKSRKIWGATVPYTEIWTIGTSPAARIKFGRDVTIGDKTVPAGSYWLLALPQKAAWTWVLNKSADTIASARDYKPELDVVRLKVSPKSSAYHERLMFTFSELSIDRTSLDLQWENLVVTLPIQVNTTQQVMQSINELDATWRSYANAARFMLETKKDYDAGLKYVDQALTFRDDWYCMWVKGALLAGKGDFVAAREWGEKARELAHRTGNGAALEPELNKAIADWTRRSGGRQKEPQALGKVGGPVSPAPSGATIDPPTFTPAAVTAPPSKVAPSSATPASATPSAATPSNAASTASPTAPSPSAAPSTAPSSASTEEPPAAARRARLRRR